MTGDRWDTRDHRDRRSRRRSPNGEPYDPGTTRRWRLQGPVAAALGELARDRWRRAGGERLPPVPVAGECWPDNLTADFDNVDVAIARSCPATTDSPPCSRSSALSRPDRPGATLHLRREPVFQPRAASPRRCRAGWTSRTGRRSSWSIRSRRMAGWSRSPWIRPAPAWSRRCAGRSAGTPAHLPSGHGQRRADLCPCQDHGRRRRGAACRLVQHQQPLDAPRHGMRRHDRCRPRGQCAGGGRHRAHPHRPSRRASRCACRSDRRCLRQDRLAHPHDRLPEIARSLPAFPTRCPICTMSKNGWPTTRCSIPTAPRKCSRT